MPAGETKNPSVAGRGDDEPPQWPAGRLEASSVSSSLGRPSSGPVLSEDIVFPAFAAARDQEPVIV